VNYHQRSPDAVVHEDPEFVTIRTSEELEIIKE